MKGSNFFKLFLILFVSTAYVFCFTYFGTTAVEQFSGSDSLYEKGTKVASSAIAGKSKEQAEAKITSLIEVWQKETSITFTYKEKTYKASNHMFDFDVYTTLQAIQSGETNELSVAIDPNLLKEQLISTSTSIDIAKVNLEGLANDMLAQARAAKSGEYTYRLEQYMEKMPSDYITISKSSVNTTKFNKEIGTLVKALPVIQIKEKSTFSLRDYLAESGQNAYTDESLSVLATAIYEAILPTNFSMIERNISSQLPAFARLGYEAKYSHKNNMDLSFMNSNERAFTLELSYTQNVLSVALKGSSFLYKYQIKEEKQQTYTPKTVIQYSPKLTEGQSMTKEEGKRGQLIQIYRLTYDESDLQTKKELIAEDFYAPVPKVVVHSLLVPPIVEEVVDEPEKEEDSETEDDEKKEDKDENQNNSSEKPNQAEKPSDTKKDTE